MSAVYSEVDEQTYHIKLSVRGRDSDRWIYASDGFVPEAIAVGGIRIEQIVHAEDKYTAGFLVLECISVLKVSS